MSDRIKGFIVTLDKDLSEEASDHVLKAIQMVKGVLAVEPITADLMGDEHIRTRTLIKLQNDVLEVFKKHFHCQV